MEENNKTVTMTSSTAFISEIMLSLMGLSGIAVVGVNVGFFHFLPMLCISLSISVGLLASLISILGIYVVWHHDYFRLKLFLKYFTLFLCLQLVFILYLYIFTNYKDSTEQKKGWLMAMDFCLALSGSASIALALHLKHKGSTTEMIKL